MDLPSRPESPPRRLRACMQCTTAKARCNFRDGENTNKHLCDRCERLKIQCTAKITRSVRRPRQLKPLVNRVASLEQQIASLVTTETSHTATATSSSKSSIHNSGSPQSYGYDIEERNDMRQLAENASEAEHLTLSPAPPFGLTWSQATFVLNDFRNLFILNFPFVLIDHGATPMDLLVEKPFLFRAIVLVAAPIPRSRVAEIRDEVLAYLSRRMLLEEEETLEILQGVLILVMWADIKYFYDKRITRLIYLALGYAHSLGITRIPLSVLESLGNPQQPDDCFSDKVAACMTQHHTVEEQRAFLGLFYVVTINSNQFARRNPLLQQANGGGLYVDVCCESLARCAGAENALAARMARLAQVSGRIAEIFGSFANRATGDSYSTLFEAQAVAIRREVDMIAGEFDPGDPSSSYLWMQYNSVVAQLYEPASKAAAASTPLYRTTCLLDCLAASRAFYEALTSMPPEKFLYHTSAFISHAQTVVTATTRLLVLEVDGWDLESARVSLDFLDVTDRMAGLFRRTVGAGKERMRRFVRETGGGGGGDAGAAWEFDEGESRGGACEELVAKMGWIGDWYRVKLEAEAGKVSSNRVSRELLEEIARIWDWSPAAEGLPFFGGLLNPLDVSYEGI